MQLVIAEKPSVARDLARVLGARPAGRGRYEGAGRVITWCVGHLVELEEPAAYDGRWKAWRLETLPMLPAEFKLRPAKHGVDQLKEVAALLRDGRFDSVVNACDAGREGELIFRYVVQWARGPASDARGGPPAFRLWISSLTDEAIRRGFAELQPASRFDALADAARARSEADWLVGMNATRAITVRARAAGGDTLYSIGRVQTPTLAMLVERERAIRAFVPRDFWEVRGTFSSASGARFPATFTVGKATRLGSAAIAETVVARCRDRRHAGNPEGPRVERVRGKTVREPPPLLFDLTSLQRTANRRFGWSAQRTLDLAQALYERHKVLTYPRTDSRHLTSDVAKELPKLFASLAALPDYAPFAAPLVARPPRPSRRVVDDAKVGDHHAIIPTGKPVRLDSLDGDERRLFDLVARRFLGAFHPDAEFAITVAVIRVGAPSTAALPPPPDEPARDGKDAPDEAPLVDRVPPPPDRFVARGRVRLVAGWQEVAGLDGADARAKDDDEPVTPLPPLVEGQPLDGAFEPLAKKTQPPRRHTEATLLAAMESAGRALEDEEMRAAMRDGGLGTPATRAAIIETLIQRGYATREKKQLRATATGEGLIGALPVASLASPELTGAWEARLGRVARGEESRARFMADIADYVRQTVEAIRAMAPPAPAARSEAHAPMERTWRGKGRGKPRRRPPRERAPSAPKTATAIGELACPRCGAGRLMAGKRGWGCRRWREGCSFVVWFETAGRRLTEAQLRDLVTKGKTRKAEFRPDGNPVEGRLVLDARADGGARFVRG